MASVAIFWTFGEVEFWPETGSVVSLSGLGWCCWLGNSGELSRGESNQDGYHDNASNGVRYDEALLVHEVLLCS